MSRKGPSKIRNVTPDAIYENPLVSKIINKMMIAGKKNAAQKQFYATLKILAEESKKDAIEVLEEAIENIKPKVEVRPRRIGGAVYQVPTPVRAHRQMSLSIRWLVNSARQRPNKQYQSFAAKLAAELLSAYNNEGAAVTKRTEVERMAEANKAFAHLRW